MDGLLGFFVLLKWSPFLLLKMLFRGKKNWTEECENVCCGHQSDEDRRLNVHYTLSVFSIAFL